MTQSQLDHEVAHALGEDVREIQPRILSILTIIQPDKLPDWIARSRLWGQSAALAALAPDLLPRNEL